MNHQETWTDIPGFDERYQVSNLGNVRTSSNARWGNKTEYRPLAKKKCTAGYFMSALYKPNGGGKCTYKLIHRLVAEAFIPNPKNLPIVNHKDGNKTNNAAENLEWVSASENSQHAVKTGLAKPSQHQKDVARQKLSIPVIMFDLGMNEIARFPSAKQASIETGAVHSSIIKCCKGKLKETNGFKWQYAEGRM